MPNKSGNAYALTVLCPLVAPRDNESSPAMLTRDFFNDVPLHEESPMARVPNTYLCRFFVLDDVVYEGRPAKSDHLRSKYLVFSCNLHGELDTWLRGMWQHAEEFVRSGFQYCVGFSSVNSADEFVRYIKRCQVETTFFFMGSTDEPLDEQLKGLYLKQEFSKFAYEHQGKSAAELQIAYQSFVERVRPFDASPRWRPGASSLGSAVIA